MILLEHTGAGDCVPMTTDSNTSQVLFPESPVYEPEEDLHKIEVSVVKHENYIISTSCTHGTLYLLKGAIKAYNKGNLVENSDILVLGLSIIHMGIITA